MGKHFNLSQPTVSLIKCYGLKIFSLLLTSIFTFIAQGQTKQQSNLNVYLNASEKCNGRDDNGNGIVDENCNRLTDEASSKITSIASKLQIQHEGDFDVAVAPNPSEGEFLVALKGSNTKSKVSLKVFDNNGRIVEVRNNLLIDQTITIGSSRHKNENCEGC